MEARELRIGNLVYNEDGKLPFAISAEEIVYVNTANFLVKPIPLTGEWLKRFGFEYGEMFYQTKYLTQLNDPFCIIVDARGFFYVDARNHELKYIHQLQNLYFALTGEELELNENRV